MILEDLLYRILLGRSGTQIWWVSAVCPVALCSVEYLIKMKIGNSCPRCFHQYMYVCKKHHCPNILRSHIVQRLWQKSLVVGTQFLDPEYIGFHGAFGYCVILGKSLTSLFLRFLTCNTKVVAAMLGHLIFIIWVSSYKLFRTSKCLLSVNFSFKYISKSGYTRVS